MIKYVVYVQMGLDSDNAGEYSGTKHDEYCDAYRELKDALESDDNIYHGWIREEEYKPLREC